MLNVPIGGARRCAAQSWPLDRIKDGQERGRGEPSTTWCWRCVPARCAPTSTDYDALPDAPLIAMVPVNLRNDARHRTAATWSARCCATWPPISTIRRNASRPSTPRCATTRRCCRNCLGPRRWRCRHDAAEPGCAEQPARLGQRDPAAVQRLHLECARRARAAVLQRRPAGRQLPDVDRAQRASAQHHVGHQCGQP